VRRSIVLTALCGVAHADSEQFASVGAGFATFSAPGEKMGDKTPPQVSPTGGGELAFSYERVIATDVALRGEFTGGLFYGGNGEGQSATSWAVVGDVGAAFRFDVFKYVPYAFAGIGGVIAGGGLIERDTDLVLVVGGGLDRLWSRKRSAGIEFRLASFGSDITVVTIGVRGTRRWGFLGD
jgi:hypothetical protein